VIACHNDNIGISIHTVEDHLILVSSSLYLDTSPTMSKLPWTSFRAFSSSSHLASSSKPIQHTVRRTWRPIDPLRTMGRRAFSGPAPFPTSGRASLLRPLNMLVVIIPFFTFSLGVWQVKRLRWKLDLIDEIQRNIEKDPMILPPNIKWVVHLTDQSQI
jgi:hypothetical protein